MDGQQQKKKKFFQRWRFFFFGVTRFFAERFLSIDLTNDWRRHLVWSKKSGNDLKAIVLARYTNTTVFLSLLFGTEMSVIYSPSKPADRIRAAMRAQSYYTIEYWTGIILCVAILFSVTALLANFTAWSIFSGLSKSNAAVVLRSDIGIYCAQLPARLVIAALYLFLGFIMMTYWTVMPTFAAALLTVFGVLIVGHIMNSFSAIGRIMMLTGAMADHSIFTDEQEESMTPQQLSDALLNRYKVAKQVDVDVMRQYRVDYQELLQDAEEGKVIYPLSSAEYEMRSTKLSMRRASQIGSTKSLPKSDVSVLSVVQEENSGRSDPLHRLSSISADGIVRSEASQKEN